MNNKEDTMKTDIFVTDSTDHDFAKIISDGLNAFNDEITHINDRQALAVVVRDANTQEVLGGAIGRSSLGLLFLDLFYLPESLRNAGLGTEILKKFEAEGRQRGCRSAVLYTISFQAPGFYERNGWRRFGEIASGPPGTSRIFMSKEL
jgi:GNAT superfamily N-acetyltransferase